MSNERILIVDDEARIVHLCTKILTRCGYTVQGAASGREAIARLEAEARPQGVRFHLLVVDIKMPDVDGLTVLRRGRELDPHLAAVIISGYGTLDSAIEALHAGAQRFVLKPFESRDLLLAVEEALAQRQKEQERLRLQAQLPILEVSQALLADGSAESMAGPLLEIVMRQIGADRAALLLLDEEADELYVAKAIGLPIDEMHTPRVSASQSVVGRSLLHQELQIVDLQSQANPEPPWQRNGVERDVSLVHVPLHGRKRRVGVLSLSRVQKPFTPVDLNLLSILGRQIAIALENTVLYKELQVSHDHLQKVLDSQHDEVLVVGRDYVITEVNKAFLRKTGYERDEVIGAYCYEVSHHRTEPCTGTEHPCPAAEVWRSGCSARSLHIHYDKAGDKAYVDVAVSPLYDDQGQAMQVVEAFRDVTTEWRLEESLTTVRELGRELVLSRDEVEIAQLVVSAAERILDFDRCSLWVVDEEKGVLRLLSYSDASHTATISSLPLDSKQGITVAVARSGEAIYLPDTYQDPRYLGGEEDTRSELCMPLTVKNRVLGVLNAESPRLDAFDEADRRLFFTLADQAALALENARLYQAVAQGEREWAETFDAITDGISIHDAEFRIVRANRTLAEWLGVPTEGLLGRTCYTLFHHAHESPSSCPLGQSMASGQPHTVEVEEPVLGGMFQISTYPLTNRQGQVSGAVHIMRDITERKQMEQQLIQSEKLAALGRLAASLAHEINNPLQALRSGLGLLIKGSYEKEKRQQYLQVASREVERLIAITERMLNFYRPSVEQRKLIDVSSVLDDVLTLADKKLQHSQVTLSRNLNRHLPSVEAVADQLWQVFLNIVLNALDAMAGGGKLTVASGLNRQRREVWISFSDTGEGISPEDMSHIFEPLYSTKPQGTGLGLAISYGIVKHHNGRIEVQSEVGVGSTFTVFLPTVGLDSIRD